MNAPTAASRLDGLLGGRAPLPAILSSPALNWLTRLRAEAVEKVGSLTVPTLRDEEWRFTDISPLTRQSFQPARVAPPIPAADVERFHFEEADIRLVFVDGVHQPGLSRGASSGPADRGVRVTNLAAGIAADPVKIEPHLARHAGFGDNVFTALNTAFLHDGALIVMPRNVASATSVHLLFVATQKDAATHPRCLVVAEAGSELTVVEDYVSLQDGPYFTNAVTEIIVAEDASVNHVRVQRDGGEAFHVATCAVSLARSSRYRSVSVAQGARISRYNLNVLQAADGAECSIDGLTLIDEHQLADTHTLIDHARPQGVSRQLHKCIVGGAAHAVFNGRILVRAGAQRTDSKQSSRNLLLSGKAQVDTKPQLEIFADDVKCAHGATVGQLDAEEVFYLRSRGLSDAAARKLLTYAFGAEIMERIPVASLRHRLEQSVLEQTAGIR